MSRAVTQRQQAEQLRPEILRAWRDGGSIASIARATGLNRNAVRSLLEAEGVRYMERPGARVPDVKALERADRVEAARAWVRKHPGSTAAEAAQGTGVPLRTLAGYLEGCPEAALLVESRIKDSVYTRELMEEHLRQVWALVPEDVRGSGGLSKLRYEATVKAEKAAGGGPRPSTALYEKRWPSWSAACLAAGVPAARRTRKTYVREFSEADMLDAVELCIAETGLTSFSAYSSWAKRNAGKPSGSLVITRFGRWGNARRSVIERSAGAA